MLLCIAERAWFSGDLKCMLIGCSCVRKNRSKEMNHGVKKQPCLPLGLGGFNASITDG